MTIAAQRVHQVYGRLASILHRPEAFGLGDSAPQPLADAIEGILLTLAQVNLDLEQLAPAENLEEELSQDADHFVSTAN